MVWVNTTIRIVHSNSTRSASILSKTLSSVFAFVQRGAFSNLRILCSFSDWVRHGHRRQLKGLGGGGFKSSMQFVYDRAYTRALNYAKFPKLFLSSRRGETYLSRSVFDGFTRWVPITGTIGTNPRAEFADWKVASDEAGLRERHIFRRPN
jgi:hypothetical protein